MRKISDVLNRKRLASCMVYNSKIRRSGGLISLLLDATIREPDMDVLQSQLWMQIASTILIAFTFLVYVFQLRAVRSASTAQNILAVHTFLQQPDVREARRILYTTLVGKPINFWTDEEKRVASLVYGTYDLAGMLIKSGFLPKAFFVNNFGENIIKSYNVLEPFLREFPANATGTKCGDHMKWLRDEALRYGITSNI